MASNDYPVLHGTVQQFKDQPVIKEREASGQTVRDFTIKTTGGKLVRVTLFPEWDDVKIVKGAGITVEGRASTNESNGRTYYNITASNLVVTLPAKKREREVVNQSAEDWG